MHSEDAVGGIGGALRRLPWNGPDINLALTTNARGGPGIVLASVAFDAGIISSNFYTTLVLAAVVTSELAGAWLEYVMRKGWPLLTPNVDEKGETEIASEAPHAA